MPENSLPTSRQLVTLRVISKLEKKLGRPVSYGEIADELGVTKASVVDMTQSLFKKGFVRNKAPKRIETAGGDRIGGTWGVSPTGKKWL